MGKKFFVKIVTDPDVDLRKCIVGLACANQAIQDGHEVSMFFASNGVKLLHSKYIEQINSGGMFPEGMILGIIESITNNARAIYCSTGSQAANGVSKENADEHLLEGYDNWMTWSGPPGVISLSAESDVQLVY
jgi:predicted peroxiredoxin